MVRRCQQCNAEEKRAENCGHPGQGDRSIARLGLLKSGHTIGDGFDSGHSGTASSKGLED